MTGFADPALQRLWRAAHASRERRGAAGDARITLLTITAEEAFALDGLPWPGRTRTVLAGATFKTTLARLDAAVTAAGGDLDAILTNAVGTAPRDLPAESRGQRERRMAFGAWLADHRWCVCIRDLSTGPRTSGRSAPPVPPTGRWWRRRWR